LLRGLRAVTQRTYRESLMSLARLYQQHPEAIRHFTELKDQLLGKTSTSESVEVIDLDLHEGINIYTHVWFGSIAFSDQQKDKKNKTALLLRDEFGRPELIVVVYLRYGGYGKEAAPLAAQIVKKWREIKQKYAKSSK
jgi:cell division protein FtsI/penicillin-binding protein 2